MDLAELSSERRFGIGAGLSIGGFAFFFATSGQMPIALVGSVTVTLGLGFLGASLEPRLSKTYDTDGWGALASGQRLTIMVGIAVGITLSYFVFAFLLHVLRVAVFPASAGV